MLDTPSVDTTGNTEVWKRVCRRLRAELGEDIFTSWFGRLELKSIEGDVAHLSVPTKFLKSWINAHYIDHILAALSSQGIHIKRIFIDVRTWGSLSGNVPLPTLKEGMLQPAVLKSLPLVAQHTHIPKVPTPQHNITSSLLQHRPTFANYQVGRSNQLAHAAAVRVARLEVDDTSAYNPLYILGAHGLGKTHLCQAITHSVVVAGGRILYLTAEKFMMQFVSTLKVQRTIELKEAMCGVDVLVVDDIHLLQGKSIVQEFGHIMSIMLDAGRPVVLTADRSPNELGQFDERIKSKLGGGLSVELNSPDEVMRSRILYARIVAAKRIRPDFDVPSEVISYVAEVIQTNYYDLDGAINRLLAHVTLTKTPLTVEVAAVAIRDLVRDTEPKRIKIEDIQKLVATHYNVSRVDILSVRRTANVVRPRQVAMYLSKILTLRSLPEIGRRFGGRDHTTVLHAVRKMEALVGKNDYLFEEIEMFKRILTS